MLRSRQGSRGGGRRTETRGILKQMEFLKTLQNVWTSETRVASLKNEMAPRSDAQSRRKRNECPTSGPTRAPTRALMRVAFPCSNSPSRTPLHESPHETSHEGVHGSAHGSAHESVQSSNESPEDFPRIASNFRASTL